VIAETVSAGVEKPPKRYIDNRPTPQWTQPRVTANFIAQSTFRKGQFGPKPGKFPGNSWKQVSPWAAEFGLQPPAPGRYSWV